MSEPKHRDIPIHPGTSPYPETPPVDERANETFLDTIFDTDGRPDSEAEDLVEIEGFEDDEDQR